ncbi:DUF930 domain-containing protein [Pseudorhizobium marinum]|uniref:DUF930 domain-containing protein n=1 Tax=Pseudorhizobium marinum TaxID=1496690 RepID=UPI0005652714|nr:DUF930 domain-containing protein [Pseudorhizobium marinum]
MQDEPEKPRNDMGWGIPASILVHVVLAAILIFGLPLELPQPPEEEEAVSVEIVEPPPEPEPPEPEPPEAEEPEPPAPPEPEPPAQEEEAEPAPEPQTEPEAQVPDEPAAPTPALRTVFEFGEETTGPEMSRDGDAATDAREPPEVTEEPIEEPVEPPAPDVLSAGPGVSPNPSIAEPAPPEVVEEAAEEDEQTAEAPLVALTEATTLFSQAVTDDLLAQTEIGDLSHPVRAALLCDTELTAQLRNASPPQDPEFVPKQPMTEGTVLELRNTGFFSVGQWHDLSFRCEINEEATKVIGFSLFIGAPVPRSEWRNRGFPDS